MDPSYEQVIKNEFLIVIILNISDLCILILYIFLKSF